MASRTFQCDTCSQAVVNTKTFISCSKCGREIVVCCGTTNPVCKKCRVCWCKKQTRRILKGKHYSKQGRSQEVNKTVELRLLRFWYEPYVIYEVCASGKCAYLRAMY